MWARARVSPKHIALLVSFALGVGGCRSSSVDPSAAFGPGLSRLSADPPERYAAASRVVAVGDLHGDLDATRAVLKLAGLIDDAGGWIGGRTTLVQTGDVLDRGDGERAILELLDRLEAEAALAGGRVVRLNGNHEIMNARGDLRYVTEQALGAFGGGATQEARAAAFEPGSPWARRLGRYGVTAIVGDTIFAHGGVRLRAVDRLGRLNRETRDWLSGRGPFPEALDDRESVIWTRVFSAGAVSEAACAELAVVLGRLNVARMVVGHTVQKLGVNSECDGRVFRIDVGLAAHYGGPNEALEIVEGEPRVLRSPPAGSR